MTKRSVAFSEWHKAFEPMLAELQAAASELDYGAQMRESTVLAKMTIKKVVATTRHAQLSRGEGDEGSPARETAPTI